MQMFHIGDLPEADDEDAFDMSENGEHMTDGAGACENGGMHRIPTITFDEDSQSSTDPMLSDISISTRRTRRPKLKIDVIGKHCISM